MEKAPYKKVDMKSYKRIKAYQTFSKIGYPYFSFTFQIDITGFLHDIKAKKYPFFLSFQYAACKALDRVSNLRMRVVNGEIVEIEHNIPSFTLALEDGTFAFCSAYPELPFDEYLKEALAAEEKVKNNPSLEDDEEEVTAMAFISSVPWFSYTSHTMEGPLPADYNPRLTWGKYYLQGEKTFLPFTIQVNHALVDGKDIADYLVALEEEMAKI
jgi:chloramphenicol O-acetyltransferase type A